MASSSGSGTSSGSSGFQNSGSEEDLQHLMDQRKRKRMISNRESARRSRMRKQKHIDDLMAQVAELRKENNQIITSMNVTTQQYLNVEAENSVLRAQVAELSHRLQSLNEIIEFLNVCTGGLAAEGSYGFGESADGFLNNYWNHLYLNQQQPLMPSANMLHY
ncbi:bZIP transcription factor 11-like [Coffea eugenioides]|uniref:bZIP transcription factor 11-like n=1 Tax=Coffea eugenioides TaxID=49369 RepID=UPI000F60651A|nr:bZIP transcription factor 11-like [Coffea eugenioides]